MYVLQVLINLGTVVVMLEYMTAFFIKYGEAILPIEMLSKKNSKHLIIGIKIIKLTSVINMILAITAALGFITDPEYFDDKTYLCRWIKETFPEYSKYMLIGVHLTSLPVAVCLAGSAVGWVYGSMTTIVQISVLHEMISAISNSSLPDTYRRDSKVYQKCIKQKMIMSIMTHEFTARYVLNCVYFKLILKFT